MKRLPLVAALAVLALFAIPAHADYPGQCSGGQTQYSLTANDDTRNYANPVCVDGLGGNDDLTLSSDADTAWGDGGGDTIAGKGGNDVIYGGASADLLYGDAGQDYLNGGGSGDIIHDGTNPSGSGDVIVDGDANSELYHCTGAGSNGNDDDLSGFSGSVFHGPGYC